MKASVLHRTQTPDPVFSWGLSWGREGEQDKHGVMGAWGGGCLELGGPEIPFENTLPW